MFLARTKPITISAATAPEARPASGRWIDPRAQRFGAATSALTVTVALLLDAWPLMTAVGLFLTLSAVLGTRWFAFSRPWPLVRRVLHIGPSELEHEMPPRFAQALGAVVLGLATVLLVVGLRPWGWLAAAAVIALQLVLAGDRPVRRVPALLPALVRPGPVRPAGWAGRSAGAASLRRAAQVLLT